MLMIRFQRVGRKNDPAFRIVLTEKRSKPKSGELEILGAFHPKTKETQMKSERILYWLSKGAKASPRVHNLLVTQGILAGKKIDVSKRAPAGTAQEPSPAAEAAMSAGVDPVRGQSPQATAAPPAAERTSNGVDIAAANS